jgi:hypothetical protein
MDQIGCVVALPAITRGTEQRHPSISECGAYRSVTNVPVTLAKEHSQLLTGRQFSLNCSAVSWVGEFNKLFSIHHLSIDFLESFEQSLFFALDEF